MRASNNINGKNIHISGAEKIVKKEDLKNICACLLERALSHSKGTPDFINIKIEPVKEENILILKALPVTNIKTNNHKEGRQILVSYLKKLNVKHIDEILKIWEQNHSMRGAILLDCETLERLEENKERGIRVTYMDINSNNSDDCSTTKKNHFQEALVLATKVANHPNIIAEICISDDPDYVTGYIASLELGYIRISTLKKYGNPHGGRIFLFKGGKQEQAECIRYLQEQRVLVEL